MFGLKTFLAGLMLGSVVSLLAMNFHVINTKEGLTVLPRANRPPMRSVYVDVRKWSVAMWSEYPEVAQAAVRYGRPDLLGDGVLNTLFPGQANTGSTEPVNTETAAQKAKLAMEALVPIKFTSPDGKTTIHEKRTSNQLGSEKSSSQTVTSSKVPDPVLPSTTFPLSNLSEKIKAAAGAVKSQVSEESAQIYDEIFPAQVRINDADLKGLPILQQPIPIYSDEPAVEIPSPQQSSPSKNNSSDLFTDVLKALIPQSTTATQVDPQHSAAMNPFQVEAPHPRNGMVIPNGTATSPKQQAPVPVVRPF